MRILITGGHGQLATDLARHLDDAVVAAPGRDVLDIARPEQVESALAGYRPDVVINTAAFHKVDVCESEPEQSFAINAAAPQRLAAACREHGALFVHVSTDYVFDGEKEAPYHEEDPMRPINVYGSSKAAGEMVVRCTTDRYLIIRTTGLYGRGGMVSRHGNFVETMLRLAGAGQPIAVVDSQTLTPTFTEDVAAVTVRLILEGATGTFHVTNSGECSWYDFACEIFRLAGLPVTPLRTNQDARPTPARRPVYSVLGHAGLRRLGLPEPRHWHDALAAYVMARQTGAK